MFKVFLCFGVNKYRKKEVNLFASDLKKSSLPQSFSYLQLPTKSLIADVYLGWINLIFQTYEAFYNFRSSQSDAENSKEIFTTIKHLEIRDVSIGLNHSFLTTKDGECHFFFNKNFLPEPLDSSPSVLKIEKAVTEDLYSIILTVDGKVFQFKYEEKPCLEELILPATIMDIACGKEHALLLSEFGTVFSYGSGSRGQLGQGSIENQKDPLSIEALNGVKIQSISAGGWHSAAISDSGDLYMWGWNESGQLGLPCNKESKEEKEVEIICCLPKIIYLNDEIVKAVCCGSRHTVALTEENHVWTWGWNSYSQLGHDDAPFSDEPDMVKLPNLFQPLQIKAKFWSTLVIGCWQTEKDSSDSEFSDE